MKLRDSNANRTIPIRFESDGMIRNFRISRTCRRNRNHAHCSTKKLQPLRRCNWNLFYIYDFMFIAKASLYRAVLFEEPVGIHNSCDNRNWTRKRLRPDSIRDSIRTKISDSQVPITYWHVIIGTTTTFWDYCTDRSQLFGAIPCTLDPWGRGWVWDWRGVHFSHWIFYLNDTNYTQPLYMQGHNY